MNKFKYTLSLNASIKSIIVFVIFAFIFYDMKKSFLLTYSDKHWGVIFIDFGIFIIYSFIMMGFYLVFLNYHKKNNRIVFYDNFFVIPGFLRFCKEIEVKNSEIVLIEIFDNRKFKIVKIQLVDGRKYEFLNELFSSEEDFNKFNEILINKFGELVVNGPFLD